MLDPARALRHPLWWGALLLLALNDHVLKGAGVLPGAVTGKLSDAAGLIVAPALLATLVAARSRRAVALCHAIPLLALAALKLVPAASAAVVAAAAAVGETWAIVADPTDLLAAPATLLAWHVLVPRMIPVARRGLAARELVLAALGALACGATSRAAPQAPAIAGGEVVVQGWSSKALQRFEGRTGRALGPIEPEDEYAYIEHPIVHEGAVWFTANGKIRAIDLRSGVAHWGHERPSTSYAALGGVDDTTVYAVVVCADGECNDPHWHAIDRATRKQRWTARGAGDVPPALGEGGVALAEGARLVVRDARTGAITWTRTFAHDARAVAIDGGVVWVVEEDANALFALSLAGGAERARFQLAESRGIGRRQWGPLPSASAAGGRFYAVVGQEVVAFAPEARQPVWRRPGIGVATSGDAVVVASGEGLLSCFDAAGRQRWQSTTATWGRGVVGDGLIAIRAGDDFVDVLDLHTGRRLVHFNLEEGRAAPPE